MTMTAEQRKAKKENFARELERLLADHRDVLGPERDADGRLCQCDGDPCPCAVPETATPVEWAIVVEWQDLLDGKSNVSLEVALGMKSTHVVGLFMAGVEMASSGGCACG